MNVALSVFAHVQNSRLIFQEKIQKNRIVHCSARWVKFLCTNNLNVGRSHFTEKSTQAMQWWHPQSLWKTWRHCGLPLLVSLHERKQQVDFKGGKTNRRLQPSTTYKVDCDILCADVISVRGYWTYLPSCLYLWQNRFEIPIILFQQSERKYHIISLLLFVANKNQLPKIDLDEKNLYLKKV